MQTLKLQTTYSMQEIPLESPTAFIVWHWSAGRPLSIACTIRSPRAIMRSLSKLKYAHLRRQRQNNEIDTEAHYAQNA